MCNGCQGFTVRPGCEKANSVVSVLPISSAPADRSRFTASASRVGRWSRYKHEPYAVGMSAVSNISLTPTGTPRSASGPGWASSSRAWRRTSTGSWKANAPSASSRSAIRARQRSAFCNAEGPGVAEMN